MQAGRKPRALPDLSSLEGVLDEMQRASAGKQQAVGVRGAGKGDGSGATAGATKQLGARVRSAKERQRVG